MSSDRFLNKRKRKMMSSNKFFVDITPLTYSQSSIGKLVVWHNKVVKVASIQLMYNKNDEIKMFVLIDQNTRVVLGFDTHENIAVVISIDQ